jgi:hypothetical protein
MLLAATQEDRENDTRSPKEYLIRPVVKPPGLRPLTTDPFGLSYHLDSELYPVQKRTSAKTPRHNQESVAQWSADSVVAFHGVEMYSKAKHGEVLPEEQRLSQGVYGVYADRELQVNGVVERPDSYALSKVALRWRDVRILVDFEKGVQIEGELTGVEREFLEGQGGHRLHEYTKAVTLFRSAGRRLLLSADTEIESAGSEDGLVQERREPEQEEWKRSVEPEYMPREIDSRVSRSPDNNEIQKVAGEEYKTIAAVRNGSSQISDKHSNKHSASESGQLRRRQLDAADGSFYNELVLKTGQVTVVVTVKVGKEVTVSLQDPSRFDHPHGLLGQTVRCAWDLPARTTGICPATFRKELNIGGRIICPKRCSCGHYTLSSDLALIAAYFPATICSATFCKEVNTGGRDTVGEHLSYSKPPGSSNLPEDAGWNHTLCIFPVLSAGHGQMLRQVCSSIRFHSSDSCSLYDNTAEAAGQSLRLKLIGASSVSVVLLSVIWADESNL